MRNIKTSSGVKERLAIGDPFVRKIIKRDSLILGNNTMRLRYVQNNDTYIRPVD